MSASGSLRFRLLTGAAVSTALALLAAGIVLSGLFQDHVRRRFEAELANHLEQMAALLEVGADGAPTLRQPLSDPRFRRPLSGLYWQVGPPEAPGLRSRSLWDAVLPLPADHVADGEVHQHVVPGPSGRRLLVLERALTFPDGAPPQRIAVAADEGEVLSATAAFNRVLWSSLGALAAVLIMAAVIQVQVGLQPLARLRAELAEVRSGRKRRFGATVPMEVKPLVDDLNALLEHSEEVIGRARLQAGNLAHALKTNLAVLANEARNLEPDNAREIGAIVVRQVDVMRRHVDHHMARARAAASRGVPGMSTSVLECASALGRVMEKLNANAGIQVNVSVSPNHAFAGDREDLDEMLGNLMENACKWARQRVEVAAWMGTNGMLTITVDDDGPGLPAERRETVLAPGVRLDESIPGAGLGLAVVQDVARLYGGDVRLENSPLGGLRTELSLPAAGN
ncbi:sensor histidine kinase [Azospirillum sp. BE72]|uniref:sensor histidine kinase n=1 Tax=Azospirillum sp. BE72 TaxID=2817776 RepID=UPI0028550FC1|nr:sensor histidine kinase [Azospirillum sp. BE72]MDR6773752.1 signal transduction histidine kinase [Azospirillum sp. BE72]